VLAVEFGDGGERRESTRAFAVILAAQLSTLLPDPITGETTSTPISPGETFEISADVVQG
jgi:hypothetical protein